MSVTVTQLAPAPRFSLRLREEATDAASAAFGLRLPLRIGDTARAGELMALKLGPDEWLLTGATPPALPSGLVHALVDISDRETQWRIDGPHAAELLSIGIARDLSRLAPGRGCRTAFDSAQVVLVREGDTAFTLSAWTSFAPHVADLLVIGQRELASGF